MPPWVYSCVAWKRKSKQKSVNQRHAHSESNGLRSEQKGELPTWSRKGKLKARTEPNQLDHGLESNHLEIDGSEKGIEILGTKAFFRNWAQR